jgi:ectoine hydroxylase
MILSQQQINYYHENGYLVIDNLFSRSEIDSLNEETATFSQLKNLPNIILENSGEVRSVFAPHKLSEKYEELYRNSDLVTFAEQLIGNEIYLYQFKLNNKRAFIGDWWEWHQDFPYWHLDDGVKLPQMTSAMILMQDTTTLQGPLTFIPKSHKNGIVDFEPKENMNSADLKHSLTADLKYTIKKKMIEELINKYGFYEATGKAGCCIFFHPNLFHASNANISPYERNTAIITYNDVNNLPPDRANNRPGYLCSREFEAIKVEQPNLI